MLTGYIGNESFLSEICAIVRAIREVNPHFIYGKSINGLTIDSLSLFLNKSDSFLLFSFLLSWCVVCDPVLGDNGCLYVPESLIPVYQNEILPLCDICTPNQFEAETLTGKKINTHDDAWAAVEWFHGKGIKTVVISSIDFASDTELVAFLSHRNGKYQYNDIEEKFEIQKKINGFRFVLLFDYYRQNK